MPAVAGHRISESHARQPSEAAVNPVILARTRRELAGITKYALVDLEPGKHDLAELRSFQDWHLRYALESVKGVAEVAPVGGFVKEYQVDLDPNKLLAYGIPIPVKWSIKNSPLPMA